MKFDRSSSSDHTVNNSNDPQLVSAQVDKWFTEKTFHCNDFSHLEELIQLKQEQGVTISLAMPTLNNEDTIGNVIQIIKTALMDEVPLLDEIIIMDSDSTDRTRQIAEDLGVPVHVHQKLLTDLEPRSGKGEALWKSLLVAKGDIIAWIDSDIVNIDPRFVYGIIGPLLSNRNVQFVKGFYRRPLKIGEELYFGAGGRVTELTARPLLNLFYPELSGVIQPLSGECAGRRGTLEQLTFFSGYGVDIGLLIDVLGKNGLDSIAQVDLLERIHNNQELNALSKMSFEILQTVLRTLEDRFGPSLLTDVNNTMNTIQYTGGTYSLEAEEIVERMRPPMITIPAYQNRHKK